MDVTLYAIIAGGVLGAAGLWYSWKRRKSR
ncbi:MAG TPA: LPXTG cell wall anchor domain-containing protein [Herpetosiphonaceae bacterium]